MKKYEVRGWYRYADNEKDFIYEEITADSQQMVISIFTQKRITIYDYPFKSNKNQITN